METTIAKFFIYLKWANFCVLGYTSTGLVLTFYLRVIRAQSWENEKSGYMSSVQKWYFPSSDRLENGRNRLRRSNYPCYPTFSSVFAPEGRFWKIAFSYIKPADFRTPHFAHCSRGSRLCLRSSGDEVRISVLAAWKSLSNGKRGRWVHFWSQISDWTPGDRITQ